MKCDIEQTQSWIDSVIKQKGIKESNRGRRYKIGEVGTNNKGYQYIIVKEYTNNTRLIRFLESGYLLFAKFKELDKGKIKDPYQPSVCGVGIIGLKIDHPQSHYLYDRWRDMLRRCYDKNCKLYDSYGGSGVTVCDEWKYFKNYIEDIESLPNADKLKLKNECWQIDKDIIKENNKIYCKEYCSVVTAIDNVMERVDRVGAVGLTCRKPLLMFDLQGEFISEFIDSKHAFIYLKETGFVSKNVKSISGDISNVCNLKKNTCHQHIFRYKEDYNTLNEAIKDVKNFIKEKQHGKRK